MQSRSDGASSTGPRLGEAVIGKVKPEGTWQRAPARVVVGQEARRATYQASPTGSIYMAASATRVAYNLAREVIGTLYELPRWKFIARLRCRAEVERSPPYGARAGREERHALTERQQELEPVEGRVLRPGLDGGVARPAPVQADSNDSRYENCYQLRHSRRTASATPRRSTNVKDDAGLLQVRLTS